MIFLLALGLVAAPLTLAATEPDNYAVSWRDRADSQIFTQSIGERKSIIRGGEANTRLDGISLKVSQTQPQFTVINPNQGAQLPSGTVVVQFTVQNFTLGDQGQTHLHYYIDGDPIPYMFYNGTTQEVLYQGQHTHFTHWRSQTSIEIYGLSPGQHTVHFVLANANHTELTNPEASQTLTFTVISPPQGEFTLQPVLSDLAFPVSMAFAPDNRLFYNEWITGKIRIIHTADPNNWQLQSEPFYQLDIKNGPEQGLLGIAVDPNFTTNKYVYVYYTAANPDRNRVVRLTDDNGTGTNFTVILDNLPTSGVHNGGNIHFGPDGKLYVTIGDAGQPDNAQDVNYLGGKILRLNKDGSIPSNNPFSGSPVYALGLRNSFDFTFHPDTDDLWATENGPTDNDEINRIIAGGNYGWPDVHGFCDGDTPGELTYCQTHTVIEPLTVFNPPIAPTGIIAISENSAYPAVYHHNLFFADFNNGKIQRVVLTGPNLTELGTLSTSYNGGEGALFDLVEGPGGFVYVSSQNRILRLILTNPPSICDGANDDVCVYLPIIVRN